MRRRTWLTCSLLAASAYLAIATWNFRAVLTAPATLLPESPLLDEKFSRLGRLDQTMVLWVVTGNAHRLLTRPWALRAEGQCHPLPNAFTLGEHMIGEGLLAALPLALSGDPILSYNAMLVSTVWIAGIAMFLLVLHMTRSPGAAFVAGLLFCLEPVRIRDTGHPFIHGDLWAPLGLLFLHRVFARGGFGNALAAALFLSLTLLESLYAVLSSMLVVGVYGLYALVTHRRHARRWLGPLLLLVALVGGVAVVVFRPYLVTRATWDVLVRPGTIFMPLAAYAPGQLAFPGWTLVVLVLAGLADRLRRRREEEGEDPRIAYALAALLIVWCSVHTVALAGLEIPSPFLLLKQVVPGLDAVRALASVGRGAALAAAVVAGYGVLAASELLGRRHAPSIAVLLSAALLAERYVPALAQANFGGSLTLAAYPARPAEEDIALLRAHTSGALLDFPPQLATAQRLGSGEYLLLASYSPGPTAACYNSFPSPLGDQLADLASTLPGTKAVDALVALGFGTLVLHADRVPQRRLTSFTNLVRNDPQIAARVALLGQTERLLLYRLTSPVAIDDEPAQLVAAAPANTTLSASHRTAIEVPFRNSSDRTYAQRAPIAPRRVEARWHTASGELVRVEHAHMIPPLAVASGATAAGRVVLETPDAPGTYVLTIHPGDGTDGAALLRANVVIDAPSAIKGPAAGP